MTWRPSRDWHGRQLPDRPPFETLADQIVRRLRGVSPDAEPRCPSSQPLLVDYAGAARLLGTTVTALKSRVSRGDNRLTAAMVTNGRSVRFNIEKLGEKFTPRGRA